MAVYPGAVNLLIPRGTVGNPAAQPRIKPTIVILHTNVGNVTLAGAARLMANTTKGQEFHYQQETGTGRLGQYVDTTIRGDNNYKANSFISGGVLCGAISIETADLYPDLSKSWSALGQRKNLEDLCVWLCQTHNIPARRCPDPYSPGIGYHSMWGFNTASNPNVNPWTNANGKTCPGPGKISEFNDLLAAVARRVSGTAEEDFMTPEDKAYLEAKFAGLDEQIWARKIDDLATVSGAAADLLRKTATTAGLLALNNKIDGVLAALNEIDPAALTAAVTAAVTAALEDVEVNANLSPADIAAIAAASAAATVAEIAS